MMKTTVFGMNCKANIICRVLHYHPKKKTNTYLADIKEQAQERFERLIEQMKQAQGITEQIKANNALEWVGWLNNMRACVMEIVEKEIIYA